MNNSSICRPCNQNVPKDDDFFKMNRSNKDQIMGKVFTILHFFPFKLMHAITCNWDPTNDDRLFKNTHFKHCKDSYFWGEFLDMTYFEGGS
jgi:hypothetical protein